MSEQVNWANRPTQEWDLSLDAFMRGFERLKEQGFLPTAETLYPLHPTDYAREVEKSE